jgi:hypothetical protein
MSVATPSALGPQTRNLVATSSSSPLGANVVITTVLREDSANFTAASLKVPPDPRIRWWVAMRVYAGGVSEPACFSRNSRIFRFGTSFRVALDRPE